MLAYRQHAYVPSRGIFQSLAAEGVLEVARSCSLHVQRAPIDMEAYHPSFMLPPNFLFPPDGKIKPGIVLKGDNGLPDPRKQLYDGTSHTGELETNNLPKFHYSGDAKSNTKADFWIDVLSLAEIGLGGEQGRDSNLIIDTGPAKISAFDPTEAYISQVMSDPFLAEYTKRPRRRPIYLITGVMIADSATIEVQKGKRSVYRAKVMINGEGFGAPVKAGPEFERETSQAAGSIWELPQPFVLAYTLKKIRKKALGGAGTRDYNDHALWDGKKRSGVDDDWEMEDFDNQMTRMPSSMNE